MSYKINIEITAEDVQDVKTHLSIIREQLLSAIKMNPNEPPSPHMYSGIHSGHSIEIKSDFEAWRDQ